LDKVAEEAHLTTTIRTLKTLRTEITEIEDSFRVAGCVIANDLWPAVHPRSRSDETGYGDLGTEIIVPTKAHWG